MSGPDTDERDPYSDGRADQLEDDMPIINELREALTALLEEQNGPPLQRRSSEWHAAIDASRRALQKATGVWAS